MLTYINIIKPRRGLIHRSRAKRGKIAPQIARCRLRRTCFDTITLTEAPPEIITNFLSECVDKNDLILPADLGGFEQYPYIFNSVNTSVIGAYISRQLINFCLAAVRDASNQRRITVLLADKAGECAGVAAEFLKLCEVCVITDRPENYEGCSDYTRLKYGSSPVITDCDNAMRADIVIAPAGLEDCGISLRGRPVISPKIEDGGYFLPPEFIQVPIDMSSACPAWLSPVIFASGIYFQDNYKDIFYQLPKKIQKGNVLFSIDDISERILGANI